MPGQGSRGLNPRAARWLALVNLVLGVVSLLLAGYRWREAEDLVLTLIWAAVGVVWLVVGFTYWWLARYGERRRR